MQQTKSLYVKSVTMSIMKLLEKSFCTEAVEILDQTTKGKEIRNTWKQLRFSKQKVNSKLNPKF